MEGVPTKILGRATSVKRLLLHDSSHILENFEEIFLFKRTIEGSIFFRLFFLVTHIAVFFSYPAAKSFGYGRGYDRDVTVNKEHSHRFLATALLWLVLGLIFGHLPHAMCGVTDHQSPLLALF